MRLLFVLIFSLIFVSCTKDKSDPESFVDPILIFSTDMPATATAGQTINGRVTCGLYSVSGQVEFRQFLMKMTATNTWSISALGNYRNWNRFLEMPVVWETDTTISVPTSGAGTYYLKFYNKEELVEIDTVIVQ